MKTQINFQSKRLKDLTRYQTQAIDLESLKVILSLNLKRLQDLARYRMEVVDSLQGSFQNNLQRLVELGRYRVNVQIVDPLKVLEENKQKEGKFRDLIIAP